MPCSIPSLTLNQVRGPLVAVAVAQVAAGGAHTACVTSQGALYTWGEGRHTRLGHGDSAMRPAPTLIQGPLTEKHVRCVTAGGAYTACVTDDGALYTWGNGHYGQLGHGDRSSRTVPAVVQGPLLGAHVVHIAAGGSHTACITSHGTLYTWGDGDDGRLGLGKNTRSSVPRLATHVG